MPALPAVPGVLLIVLKMGLVNDEDVINRIHMSYTGSAPTSAELTSAAGLVAASWDSRLAPNVHTDVSLTAVEITDLSSSSAAAGVWTGVYGGTGASGAILGAGSAARINRTIARRYRGGRPGVFFPLTSSAYLTDPQTLTGAYVTALNDAWANFEADVVADLVGTWAASAKPVSVSYYEGFTPFTFPSGRVKNLPKLRVGGPVVDPIVSYNTNPRVASQRRRNLIRT